MTNEKLLLQLNVREHAALEYAASRADVDASGEFVALLADAYLKAHQRPRDIEVQEPEDCTESVPAVCKTGEIWLLGDHRLMCGDSTSSGDVAKLMISDKASCVFTDPPYNQAGAGHTSAAGIRDSYKRLSNSDWDQSFSFHDVCENLLACISEDASVYVCTSQHLAGDIWQWMNQWSNFWGYAVWRKSNPMPSLHKRHWTWCSELICYATRGKHTFNFPPQGHALSVWDIAKNRVNDLHPTMKPVAVPAHAIAHSSSPGDIVADLFGGAGSTLLACEQLNRRARVMELNPTYCDVIIHRWQTMTGKTAVLSK